MAISVTCAKCGKELKARDELAGKKVKCPACGLVVVVPDALLPRESAEASEAADEWSLYRRPVKRRPLWPVLAGAAAGGVLVVLLLALVLSGGRSNVPAGHAPQVAPPRAATTDKAAVQPSAPAVAPRPAMPRPVAAPAGRSESPRNDVPTPTAAEPTGPQLLPGSSCPAGPLTGQLGEQVAKVLGAFLRQAVQVERLGATALQPGTRVDVSLDGRHYEGKVLREANVTVVEAGKPSVAELHVLTTDPWVLTDEVSLPEDTCIAYKGGSVEVAPLSALKAEAEERDAYVAKVIARVDVAVRDEDWDRARRVLDEGLQRYPDSLALKRRVRTLEEDPYYARIVLENRAPYGLKVTLIQGGVTVLELGIRPNGVEEVRLSKGTYAGSWHSYQGGTGENVVVQESERWVFTLRGKQDLADLEPSLAWVRTVEPIRRRSVGRLGGR